MLFIVFAAQIAAATPDCGAALNRSIIFASESRVLKKAEMTPAIIELPGPALEKECVRFGFSISATGRAENIKIVETSGERALDHSALRALKNYTFKPSALGHEHDTFMLVFKIPDSWWKRK